ncbi:MAG: hypothetical protein WDN26_24590 [Chitinophagaceae bacterium]
MKLKIKRKTTHLLLVFVSLSVTLLSCGPGGAPKDKPSVTTDSTGGSTRDTLRGPGDEPDPADSGGSVRDTLH